MNIIKKVQYNLRAIVIFISILFLLSACASSQIKTINTNHIHTNFKYKKLNDEDRLVLFALEYEKHNKKNQARKLFEKLYNQNFKDEYLLQFIENSFALKQYDDIILNVGKNKERIGKNREKILRIYILALIQKKEYDKALMETKVLLEKYNANINNELLGNIYLQKKDYQRAKNIFEKIYKNSLAPNSLLNLVDVMYSYLNEKKEAINRLENYVKIYGCNTTTCSKLLNFYQEQKNINGIIWILKDRYYRLKRLKDYSNLKKVYALLIYYLEKKDINEAIRFLEQSQADNNTLLELYTNTKKLKKAYNLARKLYNKTSNINLLAQIAILEFEKAEDKAKVLENVTKKLRYVLTILDNHIYQNYLGYLLINYDLNIKEGLALVQEALKKAPDNFAYLDSLAWGQYKLGLCKQAYKNMKKVIEGVSLDDEEIRTHWEKIKECKR